MAFSSNSKSAAYHDSINKEMFQKWTLEKLLTNLLQIYISQCSYRKSALDKKPNAKLVLKKKVLYSNDSLYIELLEICKKKTSAKWTEICSERND